MRDSVVDIKLNDVEKIGSCVVQCFDILCEIYGYNFHSYTLLGVSQNYNTRYRTIDYENKVVPRMYAMTSDEIAEIINEEMPICFYRRNFKSYDEGLQHIEEVLENKKGVCIGVNSYYVPYCVNDYHKRYGGMFNSYHFLIVKGINKKKREIYTIDPAMNVEHGVISFEDLKKGWYTGTGIERAYRKYTYFEIKEKKNFKWNAQEYYKSVVKESIDYYFKRKGKKGGGEILDGIEAIERMCDEIQEIKDYEDDVGFKKDVLQAFHDGIFFALRWTVNVNIKML